MNLVEPVKFSLSDDGDIQEVECDYIDMSNMNKLNRFKNKAFSVLYMNIRSCRQNFSSFIAFLNSLMIQFTLIILVETWLNQDIDVGFHIDGYNHINLYRNERGGGIKVYYIETLKVEILSNFTCINDYFEILSFKLLADKFKYLVSVVYRPPSASSIQFVNHFFTDIISHFPTNISSLVVGDFNLNLYNPLNLNPINDFINNMLEYRFLPIINLPAKFNLGNTITPYSLIDQMWSNGPVNFQHYSGVFKYQITDHLPLCYMFKKNNLGGYKYIKFRSITENNIGHFINLINETNFNRLFTFNNPNDAFNYFFNLLFDCYDKCFPVKLKKIKNRKLDSPWVTPSLRKCIKKKFMLYNCLKRGIISKRSFNVYVKVLKYVTMKMRQNYFLRKFKDCTNSRETWHEVNNVIKNDNKNDDILLKSDVTGGNIPLDVVPDTFNDYFCSVAGDLVNHLPREINYDVLGRLPIQENSIYLVPTNYHEVDSVIEKLPNKGKSLFDIKPNLIKRIKNILIPILVYMFNYFLVSGSYPDALKTARVIPIFKSGSKFSVKNYRPVSILPSFNKIFEVLIYDRLQSFSEITELFSDHQFGFRRNNNTTLAIFKVLSEIYKLTYREGMYSVCLFLDLSRAFDTIDRNLLMLKLDRLGYRGVANDLIRSYLENRKQYVNVNNSRSKIRSNDLGVPQGSVLGPFLFNVFINDIVTLPNSSKYLFADDSLFIVRGKTLCECVNELKNLIDSLTQWLSDNKLIANANKTKLMIFSSHNVTQLPNVIFNGKVIDWVNSFKYLGFIIDSRLKFDLHIQSLNIKLSKIQGLFYSVSRLMPRKVLMNLYFSFVYSNIIQHIIVWGSASETHLSGIRVKLNKILRMILNVKWVNNRPTLNNSQLYKSLNLLKLDDIYRLHLLKFFHFITNDRMDIFIDHFQQFLPSHNYQTRNSVIHLPPVRTDIEKRSTIYQICKLINSIDAELLIPQSKKLLNRKFHLSCLENY